MTTKIFGSTVGDGQKVIDIDAFFGATVPGFGRGLPNSNSALYRQVAWTFRCVQLRADAVSQVPYTVYKDSEDGKGEVEYTEFDLDMETLLRDTESFLLLYGASYWYKRRNRVRVKDIQLLNSGTIEPIVDRIDPTKGIIGFRQSVGTIREYKPKQIVYFRYFNPIDDLMPGVCPATASSVPGTLAVHTNMWATKFFENGAIPAVILESEKQLSPKDQKELKTAWERFTRGVRNAWRTLVLQKGTKANVVGMPVTDLAMPELLQSIKEQIATAFGIPLAMLMENIANRATAEVHRLSFWTETIIPECKFISRVLNDQLFKPMGLRFEFHFDQIEAVQAQEALKAKSYSAVMKQINDSVTTRIITVDEARTVFNDLLVKLRLPELGDTAPEPLIVKPTEPPGETEEPDKEPPIEPEKYWTELKRWKDKSLRRDKVTEFKSDIIPKELYNLIFSAQKVIGVDGAFQFLRTNDDDCTDEIKATTLIIRTMAEAYIEGGIGRRDLNVSDDELQMESC